MPTKLDLKKTLKHLYNPSTKEFATLEVPAMNFLMIDGTGDPNTSAAYKEAINALYSVAYTLKFSVKKAQGVDYPVMPLEGLWWSDNPAAFNLEQRDKWLWTMMIMQPNPVTAELVDQARQDARKKKELPALAHMRFDCCAEGLSAQIMYLGPYKDEGPTIVKMHEFIHQQGHELAGKHHEIYLSDPGRTLPARLKTVIRQPMRPK